MDETRKAALWHNERLARRINNAIERGVWPGDEEKAIRIHCECSRSGCNEFIRLTPRDFERIPRDNRHFVLCEDHVNPEIETIVGRVNGYALVEKHARARAA